MESVPILFLFYSMVDNVSRIKEVDEGNLGEA